MTKNPFYKYFETEFADNDPDDHATLSIQEAIRILRAVHSSNEFINDIVNNIVRCLYTTVSHTSPLGENGLRVLRKYLEETENEGK